MNHLFVVFEGVDGAGKSAVSTKVSEKIDAMHLESPTGEFKKIRRYVDRNLSDKGRFLFYLASNFDLSRQGLNIEDFYRCLPIALDDLEKPDITIFLYVNEEAQRIRITSRESCDNSAMDYKCLDDEKYRKILFNNYNHIAARENWICIDTSYMSIDEVVDTCIEKILTK